MHSAPPVLALDAGGTHVRAAVVDAAGHILSQTKERMAFSCLDADSSEAAEEQILAALTASLQYLLRKHPQASAAGIGFPGFFQGNTGILIASPNIPQLCEFDLATELAQRLGMAVWAQNDALLAAMGEFRFGSGRGLKQLIHITLGTGIGGGAIINAQAYAGDGGMAMEIGHLCVEPQGSKASRICGCGGSGCLEAYASATAIAARYSEISGRGVEHAGKVYELALSGDDIARQIFADAGVYLGQALAESVKLLDIHHISISGGLTAAWDSLQPALLDRLNRRLLPPLRGKVQVCVSSLEDHAGLLGAAALAMENR